MILHIFKEGFQAILLCAQKQIRLFRPFLAKKLSFLHLAPSPAVNNFKGAIKNVSCLVLELH